MEIQVPIEKLKDEASKLPEAKLLLTAIVKDDTEYDDFKRMLESFMPYVHGLAVAITGLAAPEGTKKIARLVRQFHGEYIITTPKDNHEIYAEDKEGKVFFANFAAARNAVFKLAAELHEKGKYDWWMWADSDDVLINPAELQVVARLAIKQKLDAVHMTYWYSVLQDEKTGMIKDVVIDQLRERLLKPNAFKWISRLHEVAVPIDDNFKPRISLWDVKPKEGRKLVWAHLSSADRANNNAQRNIKILELQIREEESEGREDPRTMFYLAKIYIDEAERLNSRAYLRRAKELINRYLELSGWDNERSNAREYLADIYAAEGDHHKAVEEYHLALKEHPVNHLVYLKLAKEYFELKQWEQFEWWLDLSGRMTIPEADTTIGNPLEIKYLAASLEYNRAYLKQDLPTAVKWYKIRAELMGSDLKEDKHYEALMWSKEINDAAHDFFKYAKFLKKNKRKNELLALLDAATPEMKEEQFYNQIAQDVLPITKWPEKSIVWFTGQTFEDWSDKSLSRGLGGSESAIVYLSREWAKLGYKVVVYTNCGEEKGIRDGVEYRPWQQCNFKDEFDTFIVWRNPNLLDIDIKAKRLFVDVHDILSQQDWTEERMAKIDKMFFKSEWHRSHLPKLPDEKAVVISNGIVV